MTFCSGQIPLDPVSGELVGAGDVAAQTRQVMSNLLAVVAAAGHAPTEIVKCTIFLNSLNDLQVVNGIYAEALGGHRPARATVEVARLSRDVLVEIDAICVRGYSRAYCQGFEDEAFDAMFDEVMVTLRRGR